MNKPTFVVVCFICATLLVTSYHRNRLEGDIRNIYQEIEYQKTDLEIQKKDLNDLKNKIASSQDIIEAITVTAYPPLEKHTDSTPFTTAFMTRVRPGIVALSRDVEKRHNLKAGDKIILAGIGEFTFEDRMNRRHKNRADIWMPTLDDCRQFGVKRTKLIVRR